MSALIRPADLKGVPIIFARSPFAAMNGDRFEDLRPAGETLAEIVASVPGLPRSFAERGVVCINGDPVSRHLWRSVRPKPTSDVMPIAVTLHMPLGNGGGGSGGGRKNTFALIASIALLAATVAIGAGALAPFLGAAFATGGIGATLLATGVNLAGSLLIAALSPPPVLSGAQSGGDQSKGSASADNNLISIGGPLPRVCGTFRIFPPPICEPVIEIVGENELATQAFALAGPHALSSIRIDNAAIETAENITSETREGWAGDAPLTLLTRQAKVSLPQAPLTRHLYDPSPDAQWPDGGFQALKDQSNPTADLPAWVSAVSRDSPDEIWLHLYWPAGLGYPADTTKVVTTPMRFRIRRRGDTDWINLPEIHFADHRQLLVRRAVKFIWSTAPTIPTPPTDYGPIYAFKATPQQNVASPASPPQGWAAHSAFSAGIGSDLLSSATAGANNVINTCLYADRVEFYLDSTKFPKGVYEIGLKRGAQYSNNIVFAQGTTSFTPATYTYAVGVSAVGIYDFFYYADPRALSVWRTPFVNQGTPDQVVLARVLSIWNSSPVPKTGNALLCLQATNRSLSQVSVLASGYVRDWNTTSGAWTDWKTTSNPAPHFRDVLAGSLTSRPVPSVNDTRLTDWSTRCTNYGYQFNGILDGRSMAEALSLLASAGYARPRKSESWSVIIDQDRSTQTPAQIFNPRNLANLRMEKAFADLPDGFIVTFRDSANDYQPTQTVVYRNGYGAGNARRLESVDYIGPVTSTEAIARARFDLAQVEARATFYYADADVESVVVEAGDLVGVQHDILRHYAGAAYIKAVRTSGGNVTGLVLDSKIPATQPDDFFAVDDVFGLNNVFGCVRAIDFFELVDVFTTTDIFADNPGEFGIAIRCKDGSILMKGITAQSADADDIAFNTPFADPGTSILDAGCLVQSGTLGREYLRLILREARPGKDLTAALTFVDEAPELWAVAA